METPTRVRWTMEKVPEGRRLHLRPVDEKGRRNRSISNLSVALLMWAIVAAAVVHAVVDPTFWNILGSAVFALVMFVVAFGATGFAIDQIVARIECVVGARTVSLERVGILGWAERWTIEVRDIVGVHAGTRSVAFVLRQGEPRTLPIEFLDAADAHRVAAELEAAIDEARKTAAAR